MTQFSTRQAPWMKLGTVIESDVDATEAARLGGLDFTVSLRDIQFWGPDPDTAPIGSPHGWQPAPSRKAVVRDDTGEFFDVVSADYGVLQFGEAFSFLDGINPRFVAAGTIKGGRQGFMVVQLPDMPELLMPKNDLLADKHELYVVVRTSHDRSRAVECVVMPLRMRCMNQLALNTFSRGATGRWSVHHVGDVPGKLAEANVLVDRTKAYAADFADLANRLYQTAITADEARTALRRVIKTSAETTDRRDETVNKIIDIWQHRDDTVGFAGTGWGLLNALSEHLEWERPTGNRTEQSRLLGALEGSTRRSLDTLSSVLLTRYAYSS